MVFHWFSIGEQQVVKYKSTNSSRPRYRSYSTHHCTTDHQHPQIGPQSPAPAMTTPSLNLRSPSNATHTTTLPPHRGLYTNPPHEEAQKHTGGTAHPFHIIHAHRPPRHSGSPSIRMTTPHHHRGHNSVHPHPHAHCHQHHQHTYSTQPTRNHSLHH